METLTTKKMNFFDNIEPTKIALPINEVATETLTTSALPTTRDEAWKYTRVAKIGKINFSNNSAKINSIKRFIVDSDAVQLVFINGNYSEEHSTLEQIEGVSVQKLSDCDATQIPLTNLQFEGEVFHSLNANYLNDGVLISIEKNAQVNRTIQITHILTGEQELSNFKTIVQAGAFSKANIIQGFFAENATQSFANNTTEVFVGENAHLTIDKIQYEAEETFHISTEQVAQEKDSTFTINTLTLNGGLVRNNLNIDVNGQNCTTNLNGVYLTKGKQHVDNHSIVDHKVANCESNELYKGVMDDKSTGVFNGKVFVRKDAQKINAFQSNGNVLLSDDATINSKPELEIYADDVKCSHGSTTGQLDEEAIFYLRARGISEKSARQLMVAAFTEEVFEQIENEKVLAFAKDLLKERFGWG